jgi:predicted phage baseplate assembly protein
VRVQPGAHGRAADRELVEAGKRLVDALEVGTGDRGRVPPAGARVFASYATTLAASGNAPAKSLLVLDDSPRNRALLCDVKQVQQALAEASNPAAATGGQAGETLDHAIGRAIKLREAPLRAVTLGDFETLASETPGTQIARVKAHANLNPAFDCYRAPGLIAVLIVPASDAARPTPSSALRETVRRYLERRRIIGMRVEVFGPQYLDVTVRAQVKAFANTDMEEVRRRVIDALNRFLHPLRGGPDGTGWPFGRDVHRSEVFQVIDQTEGVDHVLSMALVVANCKPQCGNVCLRPNWLVAAGQHEIEVKRR